MLEKFEVIVKEVCTKHGAGLYDLEIINTQHGKVLCVYITKINGVNISDCAKVSKELNAILDTQDIMDAAFTLEVSSPGIERPLRFKKHYASAINEWITVKTGLKNEEPEGNRPQAENNLFPKTVSGLLKEVTQEYITLECEKDVLHIPFNQIKKAKTVYRPVKKEN